MRNRMTIKQQLAHRGFARRALWPWQAERLEKLLRVTVLNVTCREGKRICLIRPETF